MNQTEIAKFLMSSKKFNPFRAGLGMVPTIHWVNCITAHLRGRIHSRQLGKVCTYAEAVQREKGSGVTYHRTSKSFHYEIDSLDAQAQFIGVSLLAELAQRGQQPIAEAVATTA